jgi:hypothetical protein
MEYNLYLKYSKKQNLDINKSGRMCENTFGEIFHATDEAVDNAAEDEDPEGTKIGFLHFTYYNQALAMSSGLSITDSRELTLMTNSEALSYLDHTLISGDTIDEIGPVTNPNIIVLLHFGISAAWRSKGIGEQVLKGLVKQMKGECGYMVVLNGQPQQHTDYTGPDSLYGIHGIELSGLEEDPDKAQWKLNAFFQRSGFRQFKNYDNVFVCNVDQSVPGPWKARQPAV